MLSEYQEYIDSGELSIMTVFRMIVEHDDIHGIMRARRYVEILKSQFTDEVKFKVSMQNHNYIHANYDGKSYTFEIDSNNVKILRGLTNVIRRE